jgi:hypothetical protein
MRMPETLKAGGRGKILALVPVLVAVVFAALLLPRSAPPDHIPLPIVDLPALLAIEANDDALAQAAREERLPTDVLELGSAIRDFLTLDANGAKPGELAEPRRRLNHALIVADPSARPEPVLRLRAWQLESFLKEAQNLEETGEESDELRALTGSLAILRRERRLDGTHWRMTPSELRAAFKERWSALLNLHQEEPFKLALDEERLLYRFKILYPHLRPAEVEQFAAQRRAAPDAKHCEAIDAGERLGLERWRLDDIRKLAAIDKDYPGDYARGVAAYRAGQYGISADAFRVWIQDHANGPFALRAENHLRAAMLAQSPAR